MTYPGDIERLCPDCGDKLHAKAVACGCGWSQAPRARASARAVQRFDQSCVWNDHGHTCGDRGVFSDGTTGGGSWYCRPHWAKLKGWPERPVMPATSFRARWYAEQGKEYDPPKLGDAPPFKCIGGAYPDQLPWAPIVTREPGEDTEVEVYGEAV